MCPKGTVLKEKKNRYGARLLAGMKGYPVHQMKYLQYQYKILLAEMKDYLVASNPPI